MSGKRNMKEFKITRFMKKKLAIYFAVVILLLIALTVIIIYINQVKGPEYKQKVLAQQQYTSITIPYRRGAILDRNNSVLAFSEDVYNVVLDCYMVNESSKSDKKIVEDTISALTSTIPTITGDMVNTALKDDPANRYHKLAKTLSYDEISDLQKLIDETPRLGGIWIEKEYKRKYPYNTLASSLIGFTVGNDIGNLGIESEYNDVLNGENGREYGYRTSDNNVERSVVQAQDGYSVVSTIDVNIQSIVEKYMKQFNDEHANVAHEGNGALNMGVIVMDPRNAEILAMSDYPNFDLNNPRALEGFASEKEIEELKKSEATTYDFLNSLWNNFCISSTFEPGSTCKLFTVAAGLETGKLKGNEVFMCDGGEQIDDYYIGCVNRSGHGEETLELAINDSCNDALMQIGALLGPEDFAKYQYIFNMGLRTTIDLPGEALTSGLIFAAEDMKPVDLATSSFGQSYNATMIQVATAFCSLINGGNYYQPHVCKKILDADGNTIETVSPTLMKQTISETTANMLMQYMKSTVDTGTAKAAKVEGYSMGGKTGTAEKLPRDNTRYVVSFIGYAPATNPEVLVYVVIDEPNDEKQDQATFASVVAKNIFQEILPYLGIMPDEVEEAEAPVE